MRVLGLASKSPFMSLSVTNGIPMDLTSSRFMDLPKYSINSTSGISRDSQYTNKKSLQDWTVLWLLTFAIEVSSSISTEIYDNKQNLNCETLLSGIFNFPRNGFSC